MVLFRLQQTLNTRTILIQQLELSKQCHIKYVHETKFEETQLKFRTIDGKF